MGIRVLVALLLVGALCQPAVAQDTPEPGPSDSTAVEASTSAPDPGAYTHDGLFLRLATGFGYNQTIADGDRGGSLATAGISLNFHAALGEIHLENFAMHAYFTSVTIITRVASLVAGEAELLGFGDDLELQYNAIGPGFTYYFVPGNIYISASFALARFVVGRSSPGRRLDVGVGWGIHVMAGREWWVSENWGMGAALEVIWADTNELRTSSTLQSVQFMLSTTYN